MSGFGAAHAEAAQRAHDGLLALYDFSSTDGDVVQDRSGAGTPVNLKISNLGEVRRAPGALEIRGKTVIKSDDASRITEAVKKSGEITIEVWLEPANASQDGPARIVTLSRNISERSFTLGQDKNLFDVRFRTNKTDRNGSPSLSSAKSSLTPKLTHVVYTRSKSGEARIYVNGKQNANRKADGDLAPWDAKNYQLAIGNELSGDRPWLGTFHLVALYDRDLSASEIERNFQAGAGASSEQLLADRKEAEKRALFENQIAPLLAERCLECHDTATKKGKLDLSRKDTAFAKVIVPGKLGKSALWDSVHADEMPEDSPLTPVQKGLLMKWIEDGATWTLDVIDPANYTHDQRAAQTWVQRLTVTEYIETVRATTGVDIETEARELLPPDLRADGFSNTAYNLNIDLKHVESFSKLAELIVQRLDVKAFAGKFRTTRGDNDDRTRGFVANLGKWLLRGPLESREVDLYAGIETTAMSTNPDLDFAAGYVIEAMLQSPKFIYRIENQRGAGSSTTVGQFELASRLSYIIWGSSPDQHLLDAAEKNRLTDRNELESQVQRMLADPRAISRSTQFASEWLDLGRLENLAPNPDKFPSWNAELAGDMRAETLAFYKAVVWDQKRPLTDLLNAQETFATPSLAKHYGLKPAGDSLARYDLSNIEGRGGLLTHGSILTIGGDEASMVTRGLFVLHDLLRGAVKDPPPCVDVTPVPTKAGLTQRGIAEGRIADKSCGGCHERFEPLAFGLEKFDGIGAWSQTDKHGNKLRDDGQILIPGEAEPVRYQNSAELMNLLAESNRVAECITWKLTQFALGRPLVAADARVLGGIHDSARKSGGTYESLIRAIVTSDLVLRTRTE